MLKKWWGNLFFCRLGIWNSFSPAGRRDFFYHRTLKLNFSVAGFRLLLKLCSWGFRVQVEIRLFSLLLRQNQQGSFTVSPDLFVQLGLFSVLKHADEWILLYATQAYEGRTACDEWWLKRVAEESISWNFQIKQIQTVNASSDTSCRYQSKTVSYSGNQLFSHTFSSSSL